MALEGPELRYTRSEDSLGRALRLAREIEQLLEAVPSSAGSTDSTRAHSTRMASAMAASLVSELEVLVRGESKRVASS
jgi:hypothetical protein